DKNTDRINRAMQMMLDDQIDPTEYKAIKNRYDKLNISLTRERTAFELTDGNFMEHLKGGFNLLKRVDKYFVEANPTVKQKIVGLIFEEKLIFENGKCRTPKFNPLVELIILNNSELQNKK